MRLVKFLYPLLVVLLAVFAIAPLEYPGAFQSHTGLLAYYNLIDLDQNPAQFFAWAPVVGRAFDLFRTEGALPYLLAETFHLLGFSYLTAIKLVYALAWIASGLAMYALARRWLSENGALLAATIYVYLPFHIATVYVRGAFAEAVAWAVLPLVLLVATRPSTVDRRPSAVFSLLPFTLLFLIQPGFAILFTLVALAIAIALRGRDALGGLRSSVGGLALGAILYLPTILRHGAQITRDGFSANFILPFQLFAASWGFGESTGSFLDQFPFQLGVAPLGLAIIALALAWRGDARAPELRRVVAVFLGAAIVLAILTFDIASPLWRGLGLFVAHPWQLLAFVGLALAIVAGAAIEFDARFARPAMLAFFVALPVVASYGYLAPRFLAANPTRPPIAIFGDNEIALLDYRIVGPLRHGATIRLHLTWQALRPVNHDYTVFVHGVHENGGYYAQADSKPQGGASPTLTWKTGQVISDTHTIQIDVDGPREDYHIEFGLYVAETGRRALTTTGADSVSVPRPGDPEPVITEQVRPK
ncbi:MAG: hypothetical protein FJ009_19050 [Chloroflexi bacterium]|nr:hypothetical protein [Chloroflexota bacterium]